MSLPLRKLVRFAGGPWQDRIVMYESSDDIIAEDTGEAAQFDKAVAREIFKNHLFKLGFDNPSGVYRPGWDVKADGVDPFRLFSLSGLPGWPTQSEIDRVTRGEYLDAVEVWWWTDIITYRAETSS